ncbi:hypothetical protein LLEC1_05990 [Akanthomyces lecanii]|uniref:Uncharacterized protein n=1 Tax=Cordyceps confragosa TaxID=2714763 RepID=A0A179IJE9_CORDF|nr:hypothetical protein LLEC1_05990 [Akanthomyces lecanii]
MKYSIVFCSSWVALAAAAPLGEQQAAAKLPFLEPGQWALDCGFRSFDDESCGTERYCKGFDESPAPFGIEGSYANSKECFDAHEPREPSKQPSEPSQTPPTPVEPSEQPPETSPTPAAPVEPSEQHSERLSTPPTHAKREEASGKLPFIEAADPDSGMDEEE